MRSTEGVYFSRLDHVRALAAYLVFVWHFLHLTDKFPVPYASAPFFPLALLDEGHTGVALFMTLSGYLFAKLTGDRAIDFPCFLWSRAVRLGPLLIVCIAAWVVIGWLAGHPIPASEIFGGILFPTWPRGTWTISIELQFYLLFPLLLLLFRRHGPFALLAIVAAAMLLRYDWWRTYGEAQHIAYWTIAGRIDQFLFGMVFALAPLRRPALRIVAGVSLAAFLVLWTEFDGGGGGYHHIDGSPSPSPLWIVIPTVEAITYGSLIALYDGASFTIPAWLDRALAKVGEWSYSIYLLHFFPAVLLRTLFWEHAGIGSFYVALIAASLAFLAFLPVAACSYHYFEKRFLAYRKPYLREPVTRAAPATR